MAFFGLKTNFKKIFLGYFCPPNKVMCQIQLSMCQFGLKWTVYIMLLKISFVEFFDDTFLWSGLQP